MMLIFADGLILGYPMNTNIPGNPPIARAIILQRRDKDMQMHEMRGYDV